LIYKVLFVLENSKGEHKCQKFESWTNEYFTVFLIFTYDWHFERRHEYECYMLWTYFITCALL